jgi:sirohydrochlorin ferrochelatase
MFHSPSPEHPTLRDFLADQLDQGKRRFALLPLFLGPSRAISQGLPKILAEFAPDYPDLQVKVGETLFRPEESDGDLEEILAENVVEQMESEGLIRPRIILVDHGSPAPAVTEVRNELASRLRGRLGARVEEVAPASMERRPGAEYAFADPLLESLLEEERFHSGKLLLALLFLAPGRHAGEGGDIDQIVARARVRFPDLEVGRTRLVGESPRFVDLLERRMNQLLRRV